MRHVIPVLLAILIAGCGVGGGGGGMPDEPTDSRIHYEPITTFENNVLSIDTTQEDGVGIQLNTQRDAESTAPYAPPIPGHSGRSWTLLKASADSASVGYVVVSWNDEDPTDFLSAGWWIHFPNQRFPDLDLFDPDNSVYLFIDGPETDPRHQPPLPVEGTVSYTGNAGGRYLYRYGDGWGDAKGKLSSEEFEAPMTLDVDFSANTIGGCIGCDGDIEVQRVHLSSAFERFGGEPMELLAHPKDYELRFAPTTFNPDGTFETEVGVTVSHPERSIEELWYGWWGGGMSNKYDGASNPRLVAGFTTVGFSETDGSASAFTAIFNVLSEDFRAPR